MTEQNIKLVRSEYTEQHQFIQWFKMQYPGVLVNASTAGARYGSERWATIRGALQKRAGASKGFPDIFIYQTAIDGPNNRMWGGLAIEMKREKGGKASKEQQEWIDRLNANGYLAVVAHGFEEAKKITIEYLRGGLCEKRSL